LKFLVKIKRTPVSAAALTLPLTFEQKFMSRKGAKNAKRSVFFADFASSRDII